MAFNVGFPATYQPMYYPQQMQMMPQMQQMPAQPPTMPAPQVQQPVPQMQQRSIIQSGFVRVMNENEARMYPVAPGNSVTFIDESAPYCYVKTVDMGQLDRPKFDRYRLTKEDDVPAPVEGPEKPSEAPVMDLSNYIMKPEFDQIKREIDAIKQDIDSFRSDLYGLAGKKKAPAKKEVTPDE